MYAHLGRIGKKFIRYVIDLPSKLIKLIIDKNNRETLHSIIILSYFILFLILRN